MLFWALLLRGEVGDDSSCFGGVYHFGEIGFGFYWSSTPEKNHFYATKVKFCGCLLFVDECNRHMGFSVRPVLVGSNTW